MDMPVTSVDEDGPVPMRIEEEIPPIADPAAPNATGTQNSESAFCQMQGGICSDSLGMPVPAAMLRLIRVSARTTNFSRALGGAVNPLQNRTRFE